MTIEELKDKKTTLGLTNEMIAASAGIPLSTVQKIMSGATKAPRKSTLVAIETVLSADERRVELIDGVFYDMSAPAVIHQKILGELYILFRACMDAHEGDCEVYLSPPECHL